MNKPEKKLKPVKVAVVSAIDFTIKVLLAAQIEAMIKEGFIVHGMCTKGPNFRTLQDKGILIFPVTIKRSISPFSDIWALWKMYRYFKREKIDIVHTHTPKCSLLGQLAAKLAGVPVIVNTVHGFYFHDYMKPWVRKFYVVIEWIASRCSSIILSQNPEDIETAVKLGICNRNKIKLLGNGVDLSKFDPTRFNTDFRRRKRIEIDVPEDAVVVGIIGRLVKEKGYLELFQAMQAIMAANDKVWLVVIGPEEPEKANSISIDAPKEYGIETRTRWLGSREDIPELLACCDIYTLPSWREGFPRSAIEAAAMGLPIVATNIRGCRQVVENGQNGILVGVRNVAEIEKALIKLIDDPQLRREMGVSGYQKARREFDEQKVCKLVLDTYKQLLDKKNGHI
jgi:glycosyltransferase involved in cell wall biosynthesis